MHSHPIDFDLPMNMGRVKAQVDHQPLDDENILIIVTIEALPKMFRALLPKSMLAEPIKRVLKRSFVREWGAKFVAWSKEPAKGQGHE